MTFAQGTVVWRIIVANVTFAPTDWFRWPFAANLRGIGYCSAWCAQIWVTSFTEYIEYR